MVELFLTACLLAQPVACEEFYAPFQRSMTLAQCARQGQLWAVRWSLDHPEWRIKGWTCTAPET